MYIVIVINSTGVSQILAYIIESPIKTDFQVPLEILMREFWVEPWKRHLLTSFQVMLKLLIFETHFA